MADNVLINAVTTPGGATIATDEVNGVQHELVKVEFGVDGVATMVSASDPLPVTGTVEVSNFPVTQPVSGTVAVSSLPTGLATSANQQTDALTDAELRAAAVPVSLSVVPLATGAATATKQDEQTAQLATLNSLIETLRSLVAVLSPLGGAMNSGAPGLRVTPNAATLPISGSVTATVSSLTNFGTSIPASEMAHDMNHLVATMANINNANG
ncbi:MAG: hypothetical protein EKK63_11670 [Acinetobacter sp.]|uniref:hypothetical protein n=1 Tax=Acinetobacter sp. TaxID=472 RepID=UPI000F9C726E|nr:hypothetical protein [Acinetobacter sp.]RUP38694.1 MAG: hypothetical protein EKK63_11670 [Acinetobacter sp.]